MHYTRTHLDFGRKQHDEDAAYHDEADDKQGEENHCPGRKTVSKIHCRWFMPMPTAPHGN